jgi:hypothetical protein
MAPGSYQYSLLDLLLATPLLANKISFDELVTFIDLARHLKARIQWNQPWDVKDPPHELPIHIHYFIRDSLCLNDDTTQLLWETFKWLAWKGSEADVTGFYPCSIAWLLLFLRFGPQNGVGMCF